MAKRTTVIVRALILWSPGEYLGPKLDRVLGRLLEMGANLDRIEMRYSRDDTGFVIEVPLGSMDPATVAQASSMADKVLIL